MKGLPAETDFIVVGAGVAGLRAAIELAAAGSVLVLSKTEIPNFKTTDAKSDAAWLSDEDEISLHLQDTLATGDGLCNLNAVKTLLEEGPERIEELIAWGKHHGTKLVFSQEITSSRSRALHAEGDVTGRAILRVLFEKAQSLKHLTIAPFAFTTELLSDGGHISGIALIDQKGVPQQVSCSAVLLATGGAGQLFRNTTNPESATGDGVAMAVRAG
ncbi:MAG: FAD-dependent oxidoreductase, partial [Candidatus Sulfotelmatobacter sp.]